MEAVEGVMEGVGVWMDGRVWMEQSRFLPSETSTRETVPVWPAKESDGGVYIEGCALRGVN